MQYFETQMPTRLIIGEGTLSKLGEVACGYGLRALIVTTGDDMEKLGILAKARASLDEAGVSSFVYSHVEPNPKAGSIDEGARVFFEHNCEMLIGLGGGSAMDAAKAIGMIAKNGGSVMDYMPDAPRYCEDLPSTYPVICVTTTAGTGSEATYFAVISNPVTHEKPGLGVPCMMPVASIVDPELMRSLPRGITAQTGVDVFFHAMEAYLNRHATPFTDMVSLEAMRLTHKWLPIALEDGSNMEARGQMAWANTLGGIAIVQSATCGLHAMGHSISGETDIAHGRALSCAAIAFMHYTWQGDIVRYAKVARILGAPEEMGDEEAARASGDLLGGFLKTCGMETTLTEAGVPAESIEKIADATEHSMKFCMEATLLPLKRDDIVQILKMSV